LSLAESLRRISIEYENQAREAFAGNELANFIRNSDESLKGIAGDAFVTRSSPGQGAWAQIPWLAAFDPEITTTAQSGYYVVYLVVPSRKEVYLSLNQGTTEMQREFGSEYLNQLQARAVLYQSMISSMTQGQSLITGPLDLGEKSDLARGYEAGNVVAKLYDQNALADKSAVEEDLKFFLAMYTNLVEVNAGTEPEGSEPEDQRGYVGHEGRRKMRWHKSAERNSRLAKAAKDVLGYDCQACGFNFENFYGERGRGYIEAHHIVPYAELADRPDPVLLDASRDFAVVCANCHRMIHRDKNQLTLSEMQELINAKRHGLK
jgi:5-methylcytosine-specific restriction protein A